MSEVEVAEKQEFIDKLAGNERYFRIMVNGYGGEATYMTISKEAHDFWKAVKDEHGDGDLVTYMINAEDESFDFEYIDQVPESAQFMKDEDGDGRPWYEPPGEFEHTYGGNYDSCWVVVDEVSSQEYNADHIAEVIDREDISDVINRIYEDTDYEVEPINSSCCDDAPSEYIAQMYSSEKGCFFDGIVAIYGDFDHTKLSFNIIEYLNGEDTVVGVEYDGEEVENAGGDTNGKGYYADVWKA